MINLAAMKSAGVKDIKSELRNKDSEELMALCLKLAKYKKENKELLSYLLFDINDERYYLEMLKAEVDDLMSNVNTLSVYYAKKGLRKTLRFVDRFIRYSDVKETEVELRIYFCKNMLDLGLRIESSRVLTNLLEGQIKKIKKAIDALHPDLQFDYNKDLVELVALF